MQMTNQAKRKKQINYLSWWDRHMLTTLTSQVFVTAYCIYPAYRPLCCRQRCLQNSCSPLPFHIRLCQRHRWMTEYIATNISGRQTSKRWQTVQSGKVSVKTPWATFGSLRRITISSFRVIGDLGAHYIVCTDRSSLFQTQIWPEPINKNGKLLLTEGALYCLMSLKSQNSKNSHEDHYCKASEHPAYPHRKVNT